MALCLLKYCWFLEESDGIRRELRYLRNKEGKEVDFFVYEEGGLGLMIEVQAADRAIAPALRYFQKRSGFPGIQVVAGDISPYDQDGISVRALLPWLEGLAC